MDSVGAGIVLNFANMPSLKASHRSRKQTVVKRQRGGNTKPRMILNAV